MDKTDREPCPWRIVDDAGGAFVFGMAGGTVWHLVGGARNAPRGQMFSQAISRTKARVPILGGSFAVWGMLFSCCDCTFTYIRRKEDPWNAIMSGAATGGILAARAGLKAAGKSALVGGVILAAIEGLNILVSRVIMPQMEQDQGGMEIKDKLEPPPDPARPRVSFAHRKKLWDPSLSDASKIHNPLAVGGASSDGAPVWDAPGFAKEPSSSGGVNNEDDKSGGGGGSWRLW